MSGRASPKRTETGATERWRAKRVQVVLDGSIDAAGPGAREAVTEAFGVWLSSPALLPRVTLDSRRAEPPALKSDGESRIYFAPITLPGHEGDLAVTLGYADATSGALQEADIIINARGKLAVLDDPDDRKRCAGHYDLQSVVTHELGHFFGLGEDASNPDATMFLMTGPCDTKRRDLAASDDESMAALYASSDASDDSDDEVKSQARPLGCGVGVGGVPRRSSPGALSMVALLALAGLRRRS